MLDRSGTFDERARAFQPRASMTVGWTMEEREVGSTVPEKVVNAPLDPIIDSSVSGDGRSCEAFPSSRHGE